MVDSLSKLGFAVKPDWSSSQVRISRAGSRSIPATTADLWVANSGTTMRFLTAMVCLGPGEYRLDGIERMRERPIADLLAALEQLGIEARSEAGNGCPPVVIHSQGLKGGNAKIRANISSQFLSGLLLAAPFAQGETILEIEGTLVSEPYVTMTVELMRRWGLRVDSSHPGQFRVPGQQRSGLLSFGIEPDASAATYFWGAAAITGGEIRVMDLTPHSLQGDVRFVEVLEQMGCSVLRGHHSLGIRGGPLRGIDVDMNAISDTVMTLAVVACFAQGPTQIRNVAHIRHKETDRIQALANELRNLGAGVDEREDGLTIHPAPLRGALLKTYNDHRMAMSLSLVGLRVPGVVLNDPACVAKTYPGYFADLQQLQKNPSLHHAPEGQS